MLKTSTMNYKTLKKEIKENIRIWKNVHVYRSTELTWLYGHVTKNDSMLFLSRFQCHSSQKEKFLKCLWKFQMFQKKKSHGKQ